MANLSQIQVGGTTYDICDTTARNSISQLETRVSQPGGTWTGNDNTVTDQKNTWRVTHFNNIIAEAGAWSSYFAISGGTITALHDVVLEISGNMYWNGGPVAQYGFGLWSAANFDSDGYISNGASGEISNFSYKASANGQCSVPFPPKFVYLATGNCFYVCRFTHSDAVYRNGTNMSYITIKVIEDRGN